MLQINVFGSPDTPRKKEDAEFGGKAPVLAPELAREGMYYRGAAAASGDDEKPGSTRAFADALVRTRERVATRIASNSIAKTERE